MDASVVVHEVADDGPAGVAARRRLGQEKDLAAPQLLDLEVVSSLHGHFRRGRLSAGRARMALQDLGDLDVERWDHGSLVLRIWQLRDSLSAYDAAYLALAEEIGCPLLTADARLAKGAEHAKSPAEVRVFT